MVNLSTGYKKLLKEFIYNPSYSNILLFIQENSPVNLEKLKEKYDEQEMKLVMKYLIDNELVSRDGNDFSFTPSSIYTYFDVFLENFKLAKGIFYDQVRSNFEQKAFNTIILKDRLNETFENLNKYSRIAAKFKSYYKKEDLYKKSALLAFDEINADALEVYEVDGTQFKMVAFKYRETPTFSQTEEELKHLNNLVKIREPLIMNNPQNDSIREKKIFAIFPLLEEEGGEKKLSNILLFGFDNRKVSMIKDHILELLDGFTLNFRLTLKTVKMIQILEDKVNQRTSELKSANNQLKEINREIDEKNKEKIKEIGIAANIQRTVVPDPKKIPKIGPLNLGASWVAMPLKMKGLDKEKANVKEVAGDFYNYYKVNDDEIGIVIADASGHGIPAALLTMMASAAFSFNSRKGGTTADICERANKEIHRAIGDIGYYLTVFYLKVNLVTLDVEFTNAGHHYAIVYRRETGVIEHWNSEGFFIGAFADAAYGYGRSKLYPGDKVVMYTDGFDESRNSEGEFFGEERIDNFTIENKDVHCKDFADMLFNYVNEFCNFAPGWDDRTLVVIDVNPDGTVDVANNKSKNIMVENMMTYLNKKEYNNAEKEVLKYIEHHGENSEILLHLGDVYYLQGMFNKAEAAFQKARKADPKDPRPLQGLTKVANATEDYTGAAEYSQEATRLALIQKKKK